MNDGKMISSLEIYELFFSPLLWVILSTLIAFLAYQLLLKRFLTRKVLEYKKLWWEHVSHPNYQSSLSTIKIREVDLNSSLSRRDFLLLNEMTLDNDFMKYRKILDRFFIQNASLCLKSTQVILFLACLEIFVQASIFILKNIINLIEQKHLLFSFTPSILRGILWINEQVEWYSIRLCLLILITIWVGRIIQAVVHNLFLSKSFEQEGPRAKVRAQTMKDIAVYLSNLILFLTLLILILKIFDIKMGALLATAGLASVSIGFAAQPLVRDFFTGFFFLIEDQFAVGDVVRINDRTGVVESLTLRIIRLRGTDGTIHVIPNGDVRIVENMTSAWSRIDYSILVDLDAPIQKVLQIFNEECYKLYLNFRDIVLEPPMVLGVESITKDGVTVRALIKTAPGEQFSLKRELNLRLFNRFKSEELRLPRNQVEAFLRPET